MSKMYKGEYRARIASARPAYTAASQIKPKISSEKKSNTSRNTADFHRFSIKSPTPNKDIYHNFVMPPKSAVTYTKQKGKGERTKRQTLDPRQGSSNEDSQTLQPLRRSATYIIQKWKTETEEKKDVQLNKPLQSFLIPPFQHSSTISQNIEHIEFNNIVILKRPVSFSKLQSKIQASQKSKIPINIIYLKPNKKLLSWTDNYCKQKEGTITEERRSIMSQAENMEYEIEFDMAPILRRSATYTIRGGKPEADNKPRDELRISQISTITTNKTDVDLNNSELVKRPMTYYTQKDESKAEQTQKNEFDEVLQDSLTQHQSKSIDISANENDIGYETVPKLRRSETYTISREQIETNLITKDNIRSPHKSKIPRSIIGIGLQEMEVLKRIVTFAKQKGRMEGQWMDKKQINELFLNSVKEPTKATRNKMDIKSQNVPTLKRSRTYTKYKPRTSRN